LGYSKSQSDKWLDEIRASLKNNEKHDSELYRYI